ncbi:hypothetical protein BYT27DRAFT_7080686, partial [Phlegmacium glaucopus]
AMLHDENVYPEPFQFKPERFLTADGLNMDKSAVAMLSGLWICPGCFLADSSFWIAIASLIAAFDIKKIGRDPELTMAICQASSGKNNSALALILDNSLTALS